MVLVALIAVASFSLSVVGCLRLWLFVIVTCCVTFCFLGVCVLIWFVTCLFCAWLRCGFVDLLVWLCVATSDFVFMFINWLCLWFMGLVSWFVLIHCLWCCFVWFVWFDVCLHLFNIVFLFV